MKLKDSLLEIARDDEFVTYILWRNDSSGKTYKNLRLTKTEEECEDWLTSSEGIECQIKYDKLMKDYNLSKLYNVMLEKAMSGDVNAARWIESFSKSDYFVDKSDEIDDFLSGVSIPGVS